MTVPLVYTVDVDKHCIWTASASNAAGIIFTVNTFGTSVDTQYAVITRYDPKLPVQKDSNPCEIQRFYARDSRAYLLAHGADPLLSNGKYGNIGIAISGSDIALCIELRVDDVNKPWPFVLRGKAV